MHQKSFFDSKSEFSKHRIAYGGVTKGKRKVFRPLDRKRPLHISVKSSHAVGKRSIVFNKLKVAELIEAKAKKYQIKIHGLELMKNHIHLAVSFKSRELVQKFMRVVFGLIARLLTGARKGKAFGKRFWDQLVFTRIVNGRRDFSRLMDYFFKNEIEREYGYAEREEIERSERRRPPDKT